MPSVCFVTLSRSDYTSTRPVIRAAMEDEDINAIVIAGGSHMLKRYGESVNAIEEDGITIHHRVTFLNEADDTDADLAHACADAVEQFVSLFEEIKPDRIFIVGDRWEMLAVATAANMLRIPIVHHSGGDITQGSADNQTRYAITTLSHLHLVALEEHGERLKRMGEEKWRVIVTGEPALRGLAMEIGEDNKTLAKLGLKRGSDYVLATFHPTSYDTLPAEDQLQFYLDVLEEIPGTIVLTAPNPDAYSGKFYNDLKAYADSHDRVRWAEALGADSYYAAMRHARYMIGNSSSGLWEAPSFALPVVNIGNRQKGRVHGPNVLNVPMEMDSVRAAIEKAKSEAFKGTLSPDDNPYVRKDTIPRIIEACKSIHSRDTLLAKQFVDPLA